MLLDVLSFSGDGKVTREVLGVRKYVFTSDARGCTLHREMMIIRTVL